MSVNVFVDREKRRQLRVRKQLRRLLRQNERRNPHRQQKNQQRTNLHSGFISTDFADWKAWPSLRVRCSRRFYFATTLTFILRLGSRPGRSDERRTHQRQ